MGKEVAESLAEIAQSMLSHRHPDDKAQDLMTAYLMPANVPMLSLSKVDEKIWLTLTENTISIEKKLLKLSNKVVKMLTAGINLLSAFEAIKTNVEPKTKDEIKKNI